jgi:hypothetical protein
MISTGGSGTLSAICSGWFMSALPPKADIRQRIEHVCFVPEADMMNGPDPAALDGLLL